MTTSHRGRAGRRPATEPPPDGAAGHDVEPDPESVARAIALRLLTAAPRSRAQLDKALARRGVPPEVAARVLDRFTEVQLIDDAAYAQLLVRTRQAERGLAPRALAHELRARGIDPEVAAAALEGIGPEDEESAARALVRRRAPSTRGLDPVRRRRRLVAMLARKGYGPGLSVRVVDEVLGDAPADAEPDSDSSWAD